VLKNAIKDLNIIGIYEGNLINMAMKADFDILQ